MRLIDYPPAGLSRPCLWPHDDPVDCDGTVAGGDCLCGCHNALRAARREALAEARAALRGRRRR